MPHRSPETAAAGAALDGKMVAGSATAELLDRAMAGQSVAGRSATFEVSIGLLKFETVPWVDGVSSRDDRNAFALARFESTYGAAARSWQVEIAESGYGLGGLAVAVDRLLPESIIAACSARALRSPAIRPMCERALATLLQRAGSGTTWLVVPEHDHALVGLVDRGGWVCASTIQFAPEAFLDSIGDVIARESMLSLIPSGDAPVLIHAGIAALPGSAGPAGVFARQPARLAVSGHEWPVVWVSGAAPSHGRSLKS